MKFVVIFFLAILSLNIAGFGHSYFVYLNNPGDMNTFSSRSVLLFYSWDLFLNNPIFGIGLDNFKKIIPEVAHSLNLPLQLNNPHNLYIKFLVEHGVVGTLLFSIPLFVIVFRLFEVISIKRRKGVFFYNELAILYVLFIFLVLSSFHNYHFHNNIYLYLGIAIGMISIVKKNNKDIA